MAITDFEFLRFRKKKKEQNGGGVLTAIEEREKVVQEDAAAAVANAEVDLILLLTRKQWRLIRISSFLYVLSCIFLLLVSLLLAPTKHLSDPLQRLKSETHITSPFYEIAIF